MRMGTFGKLEEFERTFDAMTVAELERWRSYWMRHAQQLAPKVRKLEMKRVYDIEKAIERRREKEPASPAIAILETPPDGSLGASPTKKAKAQAGRIMYIECKSGGLAGTARIGRTTFSKTGRTLYYRGRRFRSLKGTGFKSNYSDVDTGEDFWISGPKRKGGDALYGGSTRIEIDDGVREDYWRKIRRQPDRADEGVD
jgi:hypothetical protein